MERRLLFSVLVPAQLNTKVCAPTFFVEASRRAQSDFVVLLALPSPSTRLFAARPLLSF